jgi:uncharacterized membrane protein
MQARQTTASHANLHELATELAFSEEACERALGLAGLSPEPGAWRRYLSVFLMIAGTALITAGVTAFFAWNWADLGHFSKFALIELGIVAGIVASWRFGIDSLSGKCSLFAAAFLVGVLFAVYGQVYQTGADPYGLFLVWAILILPWAVVGRQQGLWLLFVVLLNLALIMYWTQVLEPPGGLWMLGQLLGPIVWLGTLVTNSDLSGAVFCLNAIALIAWEVGAAKSESWMGGDWFPRIVAFITLATVLPPTLLIIVASSFGDNVGLGPVSPVLLGLATAGCLYYYQYRKQDLFILTCCAIACIMVITSLAINIFLNDFGSMLFLAMLLIGQVAGSAYWLRNVANRWEGVQ